MIKKKKTPAEIAAHEAAKKAKRDYKSAITKARRKMITLCEEKGLATARLQLQAAMDNHSLLPKSQLISDMEILQAWADGINVYEESLR